jgi:toxin CptA
VKERRAQRLLAILTAAVWVAGLIVLARASGLSMLMPAGYAVTGMTVFGGVLLGLGAFVNRACAFGSVARLGGGDWTYLATPVGFFLGALGLHALLHPMAPEKLTDASPVLAVPAWWVVLIVLLTSGLILRRAAARDWTPVAATIAIGICFVSILLLANGAWTYTDALAQLAQGMEINSAGWRLGLLLALLTGAVVGGVGSGAFNHIRPTFAGLARCLLGGMLMAAGSLLIPGSNDSLLLIGLPMLWAYAWVAFATMCIVIAGAVLLADRRQ